MDLVYGAVWPVVVLDEIILSTKQIERLNVVRLALQLE
jgi:hypothetical protein